MPLTDRRDCAKRAAGALRDDQPAKLEPWVLVLLQKWLSPEKRKRERVQRGLKGGCPSCELLRTLARVSSALVHRSSSTRAQL